MWYQRLTTPKEDRISDCIRAQATQPGSYGWWVFVRFLPCSGQSTNSIIQIIWIRSYIGHGHMYIHIYISTIYTLSPSNFLWFLKSHWGPACIKTIYMVFMVSWLFIQPPQRDHIIEGWKDSTFLQARAEGNSWTSWTTCVRKVCVKENGNSTYCNQDNHQNIEKKWKKHVSKL